MYKDFRISTLFNTAYIDIYGSLTNLRENPLLLVLCLHEKHGEIEDRANTFPSYYKLNIRIFQNPIDFTVYINIGQSVNNVNETQGIAFPGASMKRCQN